MAILVLWHLSLLVSELAGSGLELIGGRLVLLLHPSTDKNIDRSIQEGVNRIQQFALTRTVKIGSLDLRLLNSPLLPGISFIPCSILILICAHLPSHPT